jgi:hypothetical protein
MDRGDADVEDTLCPQEDLELLQAEDRSKEQSKEVCKGQEAQV